MNDLLLYLQHTVKATPEKILIQGDNKQLSAQMLVHEIQTLAKELEHHQIRVLALYADNSPLWVTVDLACQIANVCLLPLPTFFSDQQLLHSIESAGVDCIVADDSTRLNLLITQQQSTRDITLSCGASCWKLKSPSITNMPEGTDKITFTSGSTGQPKGVCLNNTAIMSVTQSLLKRIGLTQLHHLSILPLGTLLENIGGVYASLLSGGSLTVLPAEQIGLGGSSTLNLPTLLKTIEDCQPDSMILIPEILQALMMAIDKGWQPPSSLRFVAVGGGKVAAELIQKARQSGLPVYEGYGLSECASVVSLNSPCGSDQAGSIGKPLDHVHVEIIDGEINVSGNTFLGYINEPESWNQKTIKTGDLGYFDSEGFLHIDGRRKNLIISSFGRNIHPEWIESKIANHPLIAQCFVFGDAMPFCTALISTYSQSNQQNLQANTISDWIDSVNQTLPDYARIKGWHFLAQPLTKESGLITENGRPKRTAIFEQYQPVIEHLYSLRTEAHA